MFKPLGRTGAGVLAFMAVGCGSTATTGFSPAASTPSVATTTTPTATPTATPTPTAASPISGHVWTEQTNGTPPSGSACYVEIVTTHPNGEWWCTPYDNTATKPNIGAPPALSGRPCEAWANIKSPPAWYRLCA